MGDVPHLDCPVTAFSVIVRVTLFNSSLALVDVCLLSTRYLMSARNLSLETNLSMILGGDSMNST